MTKREIVFIAVGFSGAVVLAVGWFLWQDQATQNKQLTKARQTVGNHLIPLGGSSEESSSSGLSVSSGLATSLGQLDANNNTSEGSSSPAASGSSNIDPTKFAEYEKYKDSQGSLFGEMKVGTGAELTLNKRAAVYYKGWLTNGSLFDESRAGSDGKLQPFVFKMGEHKVIPGWEQGLLGMKVGGTRLVIVPPAVGYGSQGQGSIPPNAVLVFVIQLLEVAD